MAGMQTQIRKMGYCRITKALIDSAAVERIEVNGDVMRVRCRENDEKRRYFDRMLPYDVFMVECIVGLTAQIHTRLDLRRGVPA